MTNDNTRQTAEAIATAMEVWQTVYPVFLTRGAHNPDASPERAEQLTRAYMSGWLRLRPVTLSQPATSNASEVNTQ